MKPREITEIVNDIIDDISYAGDVMRTRNSIKTSKHFHLDSAEMRGGTHSGYFKVDIQRRFGTKDTVAQILVASNVGDRNDVRDGLEQSLRTGQKYIVT